MFETDWTEEKVERLKVLWCMTTPQLSSAEIGRHLGMTKNAIVSKVRRVGLPARESPIKPGFQASTPARQPRVASNGPAAGTFPGGPRAAAVAVRDTPAAAVPTPARPKVVVALSGGCRWIDGDPGVSGWRFCDDARRDPGCPYCPTHAARAYRHPGQEEAA